MKRKYCKRKFLYFVFSFISIYVSYQLFRIIIQRLSKDEVKFDLEYAEIKEIRNSALQKLNDFAYIFSSFSDYRQTNLGYFILVFFLKKKTIKNIIIIWISGTNVVRIITFVQNAIIRNKMLQFYCVFDGNLVT